MRLAFPPYQHERAQSEQQTAQTVNKAHGRLEVRTITTTTMLSEYLTWPQASQVYVMTRQRTTRGKTTTETAYGITSLTPDEADAARLLALVRGHWSIENQLHYVRDMTLGEDACRVRTGSSAQTLAAMRNAVVHLLGGVDASSRAAATRRFAAHPKEAIALLENS